VLSLERKSAQLAGCALGVRNIQRNESFIDFFIELAILKEFEN